MKAKKIVVRSILGVVAAVVLAAAVLLWLSRDYLMWNRSHPLQVTATTLDTSGFSGFAADALRMVEMIERVHPIFIMEGYLPAYYEAMRDEFLRYARGDITRQDFIFAAWRYATALRDGHMSGFQLFAPPIMETLSGDVLTVTWLARADNLYLVGEGGQLYRVQTVGGVAPQAIFALVDEFVYSENSADRDRVLAMHARYGGFITRAGGEIVGNGVEIVAAYDGGAKTLRAYFDFFQRADERDAAPEFIIRHEFIDDIFFIDLRQFVPDASVDEAMAAIERAVTDGTRRFVVDLRGNGGGSSMVGQRLLEAMGITVPSHGAVRRFSPLQVETGWMGGFQRLQIRAISPFVRGNFYPPNAAAARNPNDVFVSVLTDHGTYSAATMFAVWVQDGGFGNVVGGISSNAPSAFGDMLRFELPYSGLVVRVSHARFLRPDAAADQAVLMPDIFVDPVEALDVALEYLRGRR